MLSPLLLLTTLALLAVTAAGFDFPNCESGPLSGTPICDETLPYMARARWIVSKMNVTEKVLRLQNSSPAIDRLGLPAYEWWSEALHGVAWSPGVNFPDGPFSCATSFPEPIGLGATFDRQLVYDVAMTTSTEGRAFSNNGVAGLDFWTPNINIFRSTRRNTRYDYHTSFVSPTAINLVGDADLLLLTPLHSSSTAVYRVSRDPRWGRGQETPGEDPYLSSEYVFYLIKGYQEGEDKKYYKVVADCKHYAGYDVEVRATEPITTIVCSYRPLSPYPLTYSSSFVVFITRFRTGMAMIVTDTMPSSAIKISSRRICRRSRAASRMPRWAVPCVLTTLSTESLPARTVRETSTPTSSRVADTPSRHMVSCSCLSSFLLCVSVVRCCECRFPYE